MGAACPRSDLAHFKPFETESVMSYQTVNLRSAVSRLRVDPSDRSDVIDLVNRLNMAFDEWDLEAMVAAFTEDAVVHHPRGVIRGYDGFRKFYDAYRPLTLGVRRHSLNHIVDAHDDGTLSVRHYMVLVRVAPAERADDVRRADLTEDTTGLPALFMHSIVTDRFRKDPGHGWRIVEKRVDQTVANAGLRPSGSG